MGGKHAICAVSACLGGLLFLAQIVLDQQDLKDNGDGGHDHIGRDECNLPGGHTSGLGVIVGFISTAVVDAYVT